MQATIDKGIDSKYLPIIELVDGHFKIPELKKTRRVWALLPHDYYHSNKRYPVLYLQDAQNLFDANAPFGSWEIDKHLSSLAASGNNDIIVIGIDHGGKERIKEYSPYYHRKFGKGEGIHYAEFITQTLKPFIDKSYRTRPEREFNGIGGSSMGGLISAYIGLVYPQYFKKLMIFSPSFWYSDEIYFNAFNHDYTKPLKIFIYAGEKESEHMTNHIKKFRSALEGGDYMPDFNEYKTKINPEGQHSENYWSGVFKEALSWLYFE